MLSVQWHVIMKGNIKRYFASGSSPARRVCVMCRFLRPMRCRTLREDEKMHQSKQHLCVIYLFIFFVASALVLSTGCSRSSGTLNMSLRPGTTVNEEERQNRITGVECEHCTFNM